MLRSILWSYTTSLRLTKARSILASLKRRNRLIPNLIDQLLDERVVAKKLGLSVAALRKWRVQKVGPAYVHVGRLVRYRVCDVLDYIASGRVEPKDRKAA